MSLYLSLKRNSASNRVALSVCMLGAVALVSSTSAQERAALAMRTEDRAVLATRGNWSLYHVDEYQLVVSPEERVKVGGACVAEAVDNGVKLSLVTLVPIELPQDKAIFGGVVMQLWSSNWSYAPAEANLTLAAGGLSLVVTGSLYDFDTVNFNLGGPGSLAATFDALVSLGTGPIQILDYRESVLANVPANGLTEIFNDLLSCSSI